MRRMRLLASATVFGLVVFIPPSATAGTAAAEGHEYEPLSLLRNEYVRLLCYASNVTAPECDAGPKMSAADLLLIIETTCTSCPRIDRTAPAIVWVGFGDDAAPVLVPPTRSGVSFEPLGTRLPRADRLTAISITDYSESTDNSIELTVTERGQAVQRRTFREPRKGFPDPSKSAVQVTVTIAPFEIPFTPSALSLDFIETDVATLSRRTAHATYQAPPYGPLDFDLGFLLPFQTVAVDRLSLRPLTKETCAVIEQIGSCQQIYLEEAKRYFYIVGTLNMTGIRNKALEGEFGALRGLARSSVGRTAIRLVWPDIVLGIGMPTVKRRFFRDNSLFVGLGWRLGTDRVRLIWGYQFTTLEELSAPRMVGDFVGDSIKEGDLVRRSSYHSSFVGISISVVSVPLIGRNSH